MKLRLRADTLRLRLTRGEVDAIGRGETVTESTRFPDGSVLTYRLVVADRQDASQTTTAQNHQLDIVVDASTAKTWAESETQVGLGEAPFQVGPLEVLIEKDFTCLAPREGDEELDTFPNPNQAA